MDLDLDNILITGTQAEHIHNFVPSEIRPLSKPVQRPKICHTIRPEERFPPPLYLAQLVRKLVATTYP